MPKPDEQVKIEGLGEDEWFSDPDEPVCWLKGVEECGGANRRICERHRVYMKVLVDPGGKPGAAGDLSMGGMLVFTEIPLDKGVRVELSISTEEGIQHASGIVCWATRKCVGSLGYEGRQCMGIKFTWMTMGMGRIFKTFEQNYVL